MIANVRSLFRALLTKNPRTSKVIRRTILRVEECEPRVTPASFEWNAPETIQANWRTELYWKKDGQPTTEFPRAADDVTIKASTGYLNVTASEECKSLNVDAGYAKTITLGGDLQVNSSGSLKGGKILVGAGKTFLLNIASFTWSGGEFWGLSGSTVKMKKGDFTLTGGAAKMEPMFVIDGGGGIGAAAIARISGLNQNLTFTAGVEAVSGGELEITQATAITLKAGTGANMNIGVGGQLTYNTTATITSELPLVISGGTATFKKGSYNINGKNATSAYSINGTLGGHLEIHAAAQVDALYGTNINGGTLDAIGAGTAFLNGKLTFDAGSITMSHSEAVGWANFFIGGDFNMVGGQLKIYVDQPTNKYNRIWVDEHMAASLGGTSSLFVHTDGYQYSPTITYDILVAASIVGDFQGFDYEGGSYATRKVNGDTTYQLYMPPPPPPPPNP